jgi:hypothetical protein
MFIAAFKQRATFPCHGLDEINPRARVQFFEDPFLGAFKNCEK